MKQISLRLLLAVSAKLVYSIFWMIFTIYVKILKLESMIFRIFQKFVLKLTDWETIVYLVKFAYSASHIDQVWPQHTNDYRFGHNYNKVNLWFIMCENHIINFDGWFINYSNFHDIIAYSTSTVTKGLMGTSEVGGLTNTIGVFSFDISSSLVQKWTYSVSCGALVSWSPSITYIYSNDNLGVAVVMMMHGNKAYVFQINSNTGAKIGSIYATSSSYAGLKSPVYAKFQTLESDLIIYYQHNTGYVSIIWDTTLNTPVTSYGSTSGAQSCTSLVWSDSYYFLYWGWSVSPATQYIDKVFYSDTNERASILSGVASFATTTAITYATTLTLTLGSYLGATTPIVSNLPTTSVPTTYNEVSKTINDFVYLGGNSVNLYTPFSKTNSLSFTYFWSISDQATTVWIWDPDVANPVTTWMTPDIVNGLMNVTAPSSTGPSETVFEYGIYYVVNANNITMYGTITLYDWTVLNCKYWSYPDRASLWTECDAGYTLSADFMSWTIPPVSNSTSGSSGGSVTNSTTGSSGGSVTNSTTGSSGGSVTNSTAGSSVGSVTNSTTGSSGGSIPTVTSSKSKNENAIVSMSTTLYVITGLASAIWIIQSMTQLTSGSSKHSFWSIMNQYQMILLLPLFGTYIDSDFKLFLTKFQLFRFDFGFLQYITVSKIDNLIEDTDYPQEAKVFRDNGIASGSFLYNYHQYFLLLLFVMIVDWVYIMVRYASKSIESKNLKQIFKYLSRLFHLTIYIRMLMEGILFMYINWMLELTQFHNAMAHPISYSFAFISIILLLSVICFVPTHYFKYKLQSGKIKTRYFKEIYWEIKNNRLSKMYTWLFLTRRALSAWAIVVLRNVDVGIKTSAFWFIQVGVLVYIITIRPFKWTKDNLIELVNEITFLWITLMISIWHTDKLWFSDLTFILISSMVVNSLIITAIIVCHNIILIKQKWKRRSNNHKIEIEDECRIEKKDHTPRVKTADPFSTNRQHEETVHNDRSHSQVFEVFKYK